MWVYILATNWTFGHCHVCEIKGISYDEKQNMLVITVILVYVNVNIIIV